MTKHSVYFKAYGGEIEIPTLVLYSTKNDKAGLKRYAKCFEAIGVDSSVVFSVHDDEEVFEMVTGQQWVIFWCINFVPSNEFVGEHPDWVFINVDNVVGVSGLARYTGISAFRGLVFDQELQMYINTGTASATEEHSVKDLATRFTKEMAKWTAAGMPKRELDVINELFYTFCNKCSDYIPGEKSNEGRCNLCGCGIKANNTGLLNKLAWATTNCPADPPKWTAEIAVDPGTIRGRERELYQQWVDIQKQEFGEQTGEICECQEE